MRVRRPGSTVEALRLLAEAGEDCKIIAGGTAIVLMIQNGLLYPEELVSLERLPGLDYIDVGPDAIRLGGLATLRSLERSTALQDALPTLTAALGLVANHRVRQRATIGGNVSEADYASDPPSVLVTLGAQVRIMSTAGERWLPLGEFLLDYYTTALEPDEMVVEVVVPRPAPRARTTYLKYVSRSVEDRPCVGVAAYVDRDETGRCTELRIAVAGATSTPFTLSDVTADCRGRILDEAAWQEVGTAFSEAITPIDDIRGSTAYRKHVTGQLVARALETTSVDGVNGAVRL
jgi:carbon-monoxide dehydrogenase medium subunit